MPWAPRGTPPTRNVADPGSRPSSADGSSGSEAGAPSSHPKAASTTAATAAPGTLTPSSPSPSKDIGKSCRASSGNGGEEAEVVTARPGEEVDERRGDVTPSGRLEVSTEGGAEARRQEQVVGRHPRHGQGDDPLDDLVGPSPPPRVERVDRGDRGQVDDARRAEVGSRRADALVEQARGVDADERRRPGPQQRRKQYLVATRRGGRRR